VDDEPIQARRATVAERLGRWGRRHPVVAGLTAVIATLLIAGTIVATATAYRFNRLPEREKTARALADSRAVEAQQAANAEKNARTETAAANQALAQAPPLERPGDFRALRGVGRGGMGVR
jgi:hypothetical protein